MTWIACFHFPRFGITAERLRHPSLQDHALALKDEKGALAVLSAEAAAAGVRVGQTMTSAQAICPLLMILPYDRAYYDQAAEPIWNLLAMESSLVQPVSPEIAYVEFSPAQLNASIASLVQAISLQTAAEFSVGIAQSKLVAYEAALSGLTGKLGSTSQASRSAERVREGGLPVVAAAALAGAGPSLQSTRPDKPFSARNTVQNIEPESSQERSLLAHIPIERLTINPTARARARRLGIRTLGHVQALPPQEILRQFRETGHTLLRLAIGEDSDPVRPLWPPRILQERLAFEDEVIDSATVEEAIRQCAETIAKQLAEAGEFCRSLTLKLTLRDSAEREESETLSHPIDSAEQIHRAGLRLFSRQSVQEPITAICLTAAGLGSGSGVQLALLDRSDSWSELPHERMQRVAATLDLLRKEYGPDTIVKAASRHVIRRIDLWIEALSRQMDIPVKVVTDKSGLPLRYRTHAIERKIASIQTCWREAEWWGGFTERTVYRVVTTAAGFAELHYNGREWRLKAMAD
jgi:nucleotidyltransferase/DNA polymerase involved in DNA repair